jgi:hypothetical protein
VDTCATEFARIANKAQRARIIRLVCPVAKSRNRSSVHSVFARDAFHCTFVTSRLILGELY